MSRAVSRAEILARVRQAIGETPAPAVPREYARTGTRSPGEVVDLLEDRLVDYKAEVQRVAAGEIGAAVASSLGPATSVVVAADLPPELKSAAQAPGVKVVVDEEPAALCAAELDEIDAVLTTAVVAIANNGTIILDSGPGQGRRIISLIPDRHVVVLWAAQVVESFPEAIGHLARTKPITMIAGPSATSDIELNRVEGVHGPRTLKVIIIE